MKAWYQWFVVACISSAAAYTQEEQALINFAAKVNNFQTVTASADWTGWGKDNSSMCPASQVSATSEYMCEPDYPGALNPNNQSWTGVICSPDGSVLCLSLPNWGLAADGSALLELAALQEVQMINLSNNTFSGDLPATLPANFSLSSANQNAIALTVLWLSNNTFSGTLPAQWGDPTVGWGGYMQIIFLDGNQLTGSLPELWSSDKALVNLGKLDLSNNRLSGSITWSNANMPYLRNLIVLPGNDFCGTVPSSFTGARWDQGLTASGMTILTNVTDFNRTCIGGNVQSSTPSNHISGGAIAGIVLAAVAGVAVALMTWGCIWFCVLRKRRRSTAADEKGQLPVKAVNLDTGTDSTAAMLAHLSMVHSSAFASKQSSFEPFNKSTPVINADTSASPEGTAFVTSRNMTNASEENQWPLPEARVIPDPLWQDVEILPENIRIAQTAAGVDWVLGQGSYGTVYKGIKDGVHEVAIKIFPAVSSPRDLESLQREIAVLRSCNNKNIVHFYGVCFKGLDAWLVMELVEKGNLYNALAYGKGLCTWYQRGAGIALDIAKGLHFLHSHNVMHLDLKSPNILLSIDGTAKIADVGLARMFTAHSVPVTKNTGTFHWMAPELISAGRCTEKADIFSFGVVLYEIMTAQQPLRGRSEPVRVPEQCPQAIADLMQSCQAELPDKRPTTSEIIQIISDNLPRKTKQQMAPARRS